MAFRYQPVVHPTVRNLYFDCTPALEETEVVSNATVTSLDTSVVTISEEAVTTAEVITEVVPDILNDDGTIKYHGYNKTMKAGKGVTYRVTTQRKVNEDIRIRIVWTGSNSNSEPVTVILPVREETTS